MEIYREHEKEFGKYLANANRKLTQYSTDDNADLLLQAKSSLDDADKMLSSMENDLRGMGSQEAGQLKRKFANNKESLQTLKYAVSNAREKKESEALMGKQEPNKREKMLSNNHILQETGDILESTNRLAIETEGIGYDALNELKGQRRVINNIGEKVNDVGTNITRANRVIKTMSNRAMCMKIMMMGTILLLVIAFAICLYIKIG